MSEDNEMELVVDDYDMIEGNSFEDEKSSGVHKHESLEEITLSFFFIVLATTLVFGHVFFIFILFIRIVNENLFKRMITKSILHLGKQYYLSNILKENNRKEMFIYLELNILLIGTFLFVLTSIPLLLSISFQGIILPMLYVLSLLSFMFFYRKIFKFIFLINNNLYFREK